MSAQPDDWGSHFRLDVKVQRSRSRTTEDSQRYTDAGVFEAHGEDALVDLVELHQLQEVDEERQAVVHGEVLPAAVFTLQRRGLSQSGGNREEMHFKCVS